jgi:glyoxalase family protein
MNDIGGIHHVTCISGDAQENLDFYTGALGMRMVKKSVNQDSPDTYHLFYADAEGHAGSDITFFPWPGMQKATPGFGLGMESSLAVPKGSLDYWAERIAKAGAKPGAIETRQGERVLPFDDPHGLHIALIETSDKRTATPWNKSPVPKDKQIIGLHAVRLWEDDADRTGSFLVDVLGFRKETASDGWQRYAVAGGGSGAHIELKQVPSEKRGRWGVGGIHHVAWRVKDEAAQLGVRQRVAEAHRRPTDVIDRFWFKSVYFMEPGGVLFELATDGPGFTADESLETLGEKLVLPPWFEAQRKEIEAGLPKLTYPSSRHVTK